MSYCTWHPFVFLTKNNLMGNFEDDILNILAATEEVKKVDDNKQKVDVIVDYYKKALGNIISMAEGLYGKDNVDMQHKFTDYAATIRKTLTGGSGSQSKENLAVFKMDKDNVTMLPGYDPLIATGFTLIIRFPEVNITGKDPHKSHRMIDCYFIINLCLSLRLSGDVRFTRGQRSFAEFRAGYMFSHANTCSGEGTPNSDGQGLCYGDSTALNSLRTKLRHEFAPEDMDMFLIGLRDYIAYESIEGTPYIKFSQVKNEEMNSSYQVSSVDQNVLYKKFISTVPKIGAQIGYRLGMFLMDTTVEFWDNLSSVTPPENLKGLDEVNGTTYTVANSSNIPEIVKQKIERYNRNNPGTRYTFKGVIIKDKLVYDTSVEKDKNKDVKMVCPEGIREGVLQTINREFNEYITRKFLCS